MQQVAIEPTFESWQAAARGLLHEGVPPAQVAWRESAASRDGVLDFSPPAPRESPPPDAVIRVPQRFIDLARTVARHPDPGRWQVLYTVLWRLVHESRELLKTTADPHVARLFLMERQVGEQGRQVAEMGRQPAEPTALVEEPLTGAAAFVPAGAGLAELRAAATRCMGCELYRHATQTVFGRGPADARIVLVGEQPGDQEDRQGAPFVGPAGEVLDRALVEVGVPRDRLYVTNAVKHFKFVERGKRRIHQTPRVAEIVACRPWMEAELAVIRPAVLVCLGATAARALLGADFRLMKERGHFFESRWAAKTIATLHPSAVLRGEDAAMQTRLYAMLVDDLRQVALTA